MNPKNKIKWNDEWISKNRCKYHFSTDLYRAYCKEVEEVTYGSFRRYVMNNKISSIATWSKEEIEWLKENFPKLGGTKCVELFPKVFSKVRTVGSICRKAHSLHLKVLDEYLPSTANYTRRVSIGTINRDDDGYLKIKTGKGSSGWERYHRYKYKEYYGGIPKGHKVLFLDGDINNFDKENLVAVPTHYLALMNRLKLKSNNPTLTKVGIKWCELYTEFRKQGWKLECGVMKKEDLL